MSYRLTWLNYFVHLMLFCVPVLCPLVVKF